MAFNTITKNVPTKATPLLIHELASSASAPMTARTRYSPNMMAMMPAEPGLITQTVNQLYKNPTMFP